MSILYVIKSVNIIVLLYISVVAGRAKKLMQQIGTVHVLITVRIHSLTMNRILILNFIN